MTEAIKWGFLLTAIGTCTFSRRWGFPLFVCTIPLMQWLPNIPVSGLNALNLMLIPLFLRALATPKPTAMAKGQRRETDPIYAMLLIFALLFLISYFKTLSADMTPRFYRQGGLHAAMLTTKGVMVDVMIYYCARHLTREPQQMLDTFKFAVGGFLFEALTAFREFLFGNAYRSTAHLGQPNKLGAFLAGYAMIPYGFLLTASGKIRLFAAVGTTMAVMGLLGALSRGALLSVAAGMFALGLFQRSKWLVIVLLVALTAPTWMPADFMERFTGAVDEEAEGFELSAEHAGRFKLWDAGWLMITDNPFGVGVEQFPWHLRTYGYDGNFIKTSHNIYVQLAAEQGMLAALIHIFIFLTLGVMAFKLARHGPNALVKSFGTAMLGVVIAFLVANNFGDGFYETNLCGIFWVLAAMTVNIKNGVGFAVMPDPAPEQKK